MTYRVKYDVVNANGLTNHNGGSVDLPKWNATAAKEQLKRRNPNAKSIKILDHDPK